MAAPPSPAGLVIESEWVGGKAKLCTGGPMVIPKAKGQEGKTYLLTAGHCIKSAGGKGRIWKADGKVIGPAEEEVQGANGDYGWILIASKGEGPYTYTNEDGDQETVRGEWQTNNANDPVPAKMIVNGTVRSIAGIKGSTPETPNYFEGKSGYEKGKVLAQGRTFNEYGGINGLVEDLVKGGGVGDSGGPYFTEGGSGEVSIQGTEVGAAIGDEGTEEGTLTANMKPIVMKEANAFKIIKKWTEEVSIVEVEGEGVPAGTTVSVKPAGNNEFEMSKAAEATIPAQPEALTFKHPEVTYYEPIGTILSEGKLSLLTTASEDRKEKKKLNLSTAAGLVGDGATIFGAISRLVVHSGLGEIECASSVLTGDVTANEGTKEDTASFSEASSCAGIEAGDLPWTIEATTKGRADIKGTPEVLVTADAGGTMCQFESKEVAGSFEPGADEMPTRLEIRISEQKFKLKSKSKEDTAKCGKEAKLSGTLSFTSEGETVEDELT